MITIGKLREFGADVDEALKRCMNNEAFYLRLVAKAMQDTAFDSLKQAVEAGDPVRGFETAHALKGVTGNLALTPLDRPVREITELLRAGTQADCSALLDEILARKQELDAMIS